MKRFLLVSSFFTVVTIIITWPLILHPATLIIDRFDGLLITWFLNWDIHSLIAGPGAWTNLYNANIFYPYSKTLAFSETMLPQAILAAPLVVFFREPLLAYNFNFLLGFIMTGVSLFYLLQFLTRNTRISILISVLFTFSTIHLNYMTHLQLFNIWPIILAILFILNKNYKLYILSFIISVLTTVLNLYFLLSIVVIVIFFMRKEFIRIAVSTCLAGVISLPFLLPYYQVSKEFHYTRPINDAIHFSLQFPDLANISNINRLSTLIGPVAKTTPAFPGATFVLLSSAVAFMLFQQYKIKKTLHPNKQTGIYIKMFLLIAFVSFILSLGPALHLRPDTVHIGPLPAFPLPYALFYYILPGFSGFRTPSRWIILTFLALSITISLILRKKISSSLTVLLIVLILIEVRIPFKYSSVPSVHSFPPEQQWLTNNYKNSPIIQFPLYNWDDSTPPRLRGAKLPELYVSGFGMETLREYYSTIHYHPMFNGYSGFSPKQWENRVKSLQKEFPSSQSISYLQSIKIKLVLVPRSWENRMRLYPDLKLIKRFPKTLMYKLL